MKFNYIAIEREYGSGGTKIAHKLAEELKIPCYGRELLEMVSKENNIAVEEIERYEESITNSFLYTMYLISQVQSGKGEGMTSEGLIFLAEQAIIDRLAGNGPAVFLGHCSAEALKSRKGVLRVFICSNPADKKLRVTEEYGINKNEAESVMKRFDKKRANYYFANTGKKWNDSANYHLVLDSGKLGIDGCVSALKGLYNSI